MSVLSFALDYDQVAGQDLAAQVTGDLATEYGNLAVTYASFFSPVDTGLLRSSNQFRGPEVSGFLAEGQVLNPVRYAMPVHERKPFLAEGGAEAAAELGFVFTRP